MKSRKLIAVVIAAVLAGAAAYFGVLDAVDPFLEDLHEDEPCDVAAPAPDLGAGSSDSGGRDGSSGSSGQ